jgi:hypothetical protein
MESEQTKVHWLIELIKASAWPCVAVFVVISFWGPLQASARLLPRLLQDTETIEVSGVKINVRNSIAERTPARVKVVLPKLSPAGIEYILENPQVSKARSTDPTLAPDVAELIGAGLCVPMTKEDLAAAAKKDSRADRKTKYLTGITCGDTYDEVREFLVSLIPDMVRGALGKPDRRPLGERK